jgi:hypothetical protein
MWPWTLSKGVEFRQSPPHPPDRLLLRRASLVRVRPRNRSRQHVLHRVGREKRGRVRRPRRKRNRRKGTKRILHQLGGAVLCVRMNVT